VVRLGFSGLPNIILQLVAEQNYRKIQLLYLIF
jgi:hypothetical protein